MYRSSPLTSLHLTLYLGSTSSFSLKHASAPFSFPHLPSPPQPPPHPTHTHKKRKGAGSPGRSASDTSELEIRLLRASSHRSVVSSAAPVLWGAFVTRARVCDAARLVTLSLAWLEDVVGRCDGGTRNPWGPSGRASILAASSRGSPLHGTGAPRVSPEHATGLPLPPRRSP